MTEQQQLTIVNKISLLEDLQHQYLMELPTDLRHALKFMMNKSMSATKNLIREFDRIHTPENSENFGIDADELRQVVDNYINNHKYEKLTEN